MRNLKSFLKSPAKISLLLLSFVFLLSGGCSSDEKKILKAIIYRTKHPAYIDSIFQVMHGKPGGELRGWMDSTSDTVEYIKLLFPAAISGNSVKIGRIWLEEPYVLLTEEELKEKYYPFIDRFGQFIQKEWPGKIHDEKDLDTHNKKEMEDLAAHPGSPEWNKYGGVGKRSPVKPNRPVQGGKIRGKMVVC